MYVTMFFNSNENITYFQLENSSHRYYDVVLDDDEYTIAEMKQYLLDAVNLQSSTSIWSIIKLFRTTTFMMMLFILLLILLGLCLVTIFLLIRRLKRSEMYHLQQQKIKDDEQLVQLQSINIVPETTNSNDNYFSLYDTTNFTDDSYHEYANQL